MIFSIVIHIQYFVNSKNISMVYNKSPLSCFNSVFQFCFTNLCMIRVVNIDIQLGFKEMKGFKEDDKIK